MIKEEYIIPTVEVVEMEVVSMLAKSIENDEQIGGDSSVAPDGELANRRRNFWDEIGGR